MRRAIDSIAMRSRRSRGVPRSNARTVPANGAAAPARTERRGRVLARLDSGHQRGPQARGDGQPIERQVRQRVEHRRQIGIAQLIGMPLGVPWRVGLAARVVERGQEGWGLRPARPAAAPSAAPRAATRAAKKRASCPSSRASSRRRNSSARDGAAPTSDVQARSSPGTAHPAGVRARAVAACANAPGHSRTICASRRGSPASHSRTPGPALERSAGHEQGPPILHDGREEIGLRFERQDAPPHLIRERRQQRHRRGVGCAASEEAGTVRGPNTSVNVIARLPLGFETMAPCSARANSIRA